MISWRLYEPRDEQAVKTLHARLETKVGRKLDLPDLMKEPVLAALVGETNGVVTHGIFLEAEAEVCVIGDNVLSPKSAREAETYLLSVLERFKIRIVRAFVPTEMVEPKDKKKPALLRVLEGMGFRREESSLVSQFYRWVSADGCPAEVQDRERK